MTKIYADGANIGQIRQLAADPLIEGLTTNPTLMRKAGVTNYADFVKEVLNATDKPVSFELIADDYDEMWRQALVLGRYANNVFVKVPITNTQGHFNGILIGNLASAGIRVNVTAITTHVQIDVACKYLSEDVPSNISIFAGRIADTGVNPEPYIQHAIDAAPYGCQIIWASPREVYNVVQARKLGCDIITMTPELIAKLPLLGKSLEDMSLDTVRMFYSDAQASGLKL